MMCLFRLCAFSLFQCCLTTRDCIPLVDLVFSGLGIQLLSNELKAACLHRLITTYEGQVVSNSLP